MSLTATIYTFEIDLVDHDRQVYDTLFVRAARHPSESEEYLWTRVLAFAAEHTEGIEFSPGGLSDPDQPAIVVRDLTGRMTAWIEIGLPDAERMHRATNLWEFDDAVTGPVHGFAGADDYWCRASAKPWLKSIAVPTLAINPNELSIADAQKQLGMREGFDVGLEMSGSPQAFRDMLVNMAHGGKIAMLGIMPAPAAIDWNTVVFNGLTIKGIYGREMFETWYKMTSMVQSGLDISPVISHRFPYQQFEEAFELMRSGRSGKIVLDWSA